MTFYITFFNSQTTEAVIYICVKIRNWNGKVFLRLIASMFANELVYIILCNL